MGGTYLTGACHHWRKEERESGRDLFLNQQEGSHSREYRCAVQSACHAFVKEACQRNRGEKLQVRLTLAQLAVNMSAEDGEKFKQRIANLQLSSYSILTRYEFLSMSPILSSSSTFLSAAKVMGTLKWVSLRASSLR